MQEIVVRDPVLCEPRDKHLPPTEDAPRVRGRKKPPGRKQEPAAPYSAAPHFRRAGR